MEKTLETINFAINVEKQGLYTYLEAARKYRDIGIKNMFVSLAIDEFHHMEILEKEKENLIAGKVYEKLEIATSELEKLHPLIKQAQKKRGKKSEISEVEALNIALKQEKLSRDYYLSKSEELKSKYPEVAKLLMRLADMEQVHYDLILAQIDYIKGTGFWFDIPEFSPESKI